MDHHKKRGWPFWFAVVLIIAPLLYVGSFGPAIWLTGEKYVGESTASAFYWPILWSAGHATSLENAVDWWGSQWVPYGKWVNLHVATDEFDAYFQFPSEPPADYPPDEGGVMGSARAAL